MRSLLRLALLASRSASLEKLVSTIKASKATKNAEIGAMGKVWV